MLGRDIFIGQRGHLVGRFGKDLREFRADPRLGTAGSLRQMFRLVVNHLLERCDVGADLLQQGRDVSVGLFQQGSQEVNRLDFGIPRGNGDLRRALNGFL